MGSLRTLFAIAVVVAHSSGSDVFVGARNAVQLFYMISGFLMSYVLVERRAYPSITSFYINRYLRLYPIYLVVALITLLAYTVATVWMDVDVPFFRVYREAPIAADVLLAVANAGLFLQDWVMFAGVAHHDLVFTSNFNASDVVLYPGLLVPQAWTLGVELSFYLLAPFVLASRRALGTLLALSIALRLYLLHGGLGASDPWTYRFFPTELALFCLGALSQQLLLPVYRRAWSPEGVESYARASTATLTALTLIFWLIPGDETLKSLGLFCVFLLLMPLAFLFQASHRWDRWIGDLSYPVYICHTFVVYGVGFVASRLGIKDKVLTSAAVVVIAVLFAALLNKYVGNPIESIRNRYRERRSGAAPMTRLASSLDPSQ